MLGCEKKLFSTLSFVATSNTSSPDTVYDTKLGSSPEMQPHASVVTICNLHSAAGLFLFLYPQSKMSKQIQFLTFPDVKLTFHYLLHACEGGLSV